jgi:hypothetical protein
MTSNLNKNAPRSFEINSLKVGILCNGMDFIGELTTISTIGYSKVEV